MMKEAYPRNLQLWPGGKCVTVRGEDEKLRIKDGEKWRKPADDERRAIYIEELAEKYAARDILCCDSALVGDLLKLESFEGFAIDDVENYYPDPSDWDIVECKDWLEDHGVDSRAIGAVDDEELDGLDKWRDAVRDNADAAEIYEWWRVDSWLCAQLKDIGECVIDNGYGCWWGRTCTGQGYIMDGTLQEVAAKYVP